MVIIFNYDKMTIYYVLLAESSLKKELCIMSLNVLSPNVHILLNVLAVLAIKVKTSL